MATKPDHYQTLGLRTTATKKEIKQAYRDLAKQLHPDYNPDDGNAEIRFKQVGEAYAILKDERKRGKYDRLHGFNSPLPQTATGSVFAQSTYTDATPSPSRQTTVEFSFWGDSETMRFLFAGALAIAAIILLCGEHIFSLPFVFALIPALALAYYFRDALAYFASEFRGWQLVLVWFMILALIFGLANSEQYYAVYGADANADESPLLVFAPLRLWFYVYFLIDQSIWGAAIKGGLLLWVISLFIRKIRISAWIFFALLFFITLVAKYDTDSMAGFVRYYTDLFSIETIAKQAHHEKTP